MVKMGGNGGVNAVGLRGRISEVLEKHGRDSTGLNPARQRRFRNQI